MPSHKDIAIAIGKYQAADGSEKNRYKTIGRLVTKDDGGEFLMLDADIFHASLFALVNKDRKDRVACSLFEPRDYASAPTQQAKPAGELNDDIPF